MDLTAAPPESKEQRRIYHPECLFCVATGKALIAGRGEGGGAKEDGEEEGSGEGEEEEEEEVMLGDDDGLPYCTSAYEEKFRSRSAVTGEAFGESEEIFLLCGLPVSKVDLTALLHARPWCAFCSRCSTVAM